MDKMRRIHKEFTPHDYSYLSVPLHDLNLTQLVMKCLGSGHLSISLSLSLTFL